MFMKLILSTALFQIACSFSPWGGDAHRGGPYRPLALSNSVISDSPPASTKEKITMEAEELFGVLEDKTNGRHKLLVAQIAPSVRVAMPEEFGAPPGSLPTNQLVSALRKLGFDLVYDVNTAADLTIIEEGTELLHRIQANLARDKSEIPNLSENVGNLKSQAPLPLFTSCCPGWMCFVENNAPELAPFVSTCKSPHMMYGSFVKEYSEATLGQPAENVYLCSIMPCVRKRGESDRLAFEKDGIRQVDNVITTKDLGLMLRKRGINPFELEPSEFDSPFQNDGEGSGAAQLFGATGGVMEAAVRTVYELVTGRPLPNLELDAVRGLEGIKEATIPLYLEDGTGLPIDLRVAVCSGLGNAKKLIKRMKDGEVNYDFVEVMACPGGCINGGGQPRGDQAVVKKRLEVTYDIDRSLPRRKSHENPIVDEMYKRFVGEHGGHKAHELFHVEPVYGGTPGKENDTCE